MDYPFKVNPVPTWLPSIEQPALSDDQRPKLSAGRFLAQNTGCTNIQLIDKPTKKSKTLRQACNVLISVAVIRRPFFFITAAGNIAGPAQKL